MRLISFLVFFVFAGISCRGATDDALASKTLVVYNSNDPDSIMLAQYYAARRKIPDSQLVPLKCTIESEEISRDEYDETIAKP